MKEKMKMKKSAIVFFFAAFLSITAMAQSVQDGINDYMQRDTKVQNPNFRN